MIQLANELVIYEKCYNPSKERNLQRKVAAGI